jgi:hypothetical protein
MAGPNYDVAELVLKELKGLTSATTTWGTVCKETALPLHDNPDLWSPAFNFYCLPIKLQRRLVQQSLSFCFNWKYRMLRCVSKKFYHISFMDSSGEDWHWAYCFKNYHGSPPPDSPASWSWSGASERSFLCKELSDSDNWGESSSGSDDVDLLAEYKARGGV